MSIALYVDDLFLVGELLGEIEKVKAGLSTEFKMKDLGEARFLLGIEIYTNTWVYAFTQTLCDNPF